MKLDKVLCSMLLCALLGLTMHKNTTVFYFLQRSKTNLKPPDAKTQKPSEKTRTYSATKCRRATLLGLQVITRFQVLQSK